MLGSQILITGLFAVSLDLILGYAGIVSLGHAAFFGLGAYTAGLLAVHGWGEPLTGLVAAAAVAALAGFAISFLVVRGQDLARLMVTLGIGLMLFEAANKAAFITGGVDGLSGVTMWKLLGLFAFRLDGKTAYVYALAVAFVLFVVLRRVVNSPFGLSLRGIRDGGKRMPAIGAPVERRLTAVFTLSAGIAGVAGALLAQTTQFVGLDSLGFPRSAEIMIMLVLGGAGRLYGALVGATVYMIAQDILSGINPVYWQFWIGLLLVIVVLFARDGILGGAARLRGIFGGRRTMTAALRTTGLSKHWGSFKAASEVSLALPAGARHALIGPNGAGKTTLINLLTGVYAPTAGEVFLGEERITSLPQHERVKRGLTRTFQITTLFPGLTVLESVVLAICERKGVATRWHRTVAQGKDEIDEAIGHPGVAAAHPRRRQHDAPSRLRQAAARGDRAGACHAAEDPSARRACERHSGGGECRAVQRARRIAARRDDPVHRARHEARLPLCRSDHGAGRRARAGRGHAGTDRRRHAREGGLSRRGAAWLSCSRSPTSPPATATP